MALTSSARLRWLNAPGRISHSIILPPAYHPRGNDSSSQDTNFWPELKSAFSLAMRSLSPTEVLKMTFVTTLILNILSITCLQIYDDVKVCRPWRRPGLTYFPEKSTALLHAPPNLRIWP